MSFVVLKIREREIEKGGGGGGGGKEIVMSVFYEKDIYLKREKMKKFRPEKKEEKKTV